MDLGEKYKKEELAEHIRSKPDTYVGGADMIEENLPIFDPKKNKIVEKDCEFVPALLNIYNEIIVNAKDQVTRLSEQKGDIQKVTDIKVTINEATGEIIVYNNGDGVDVAEHPTEKDSNGKAIMIPQLIFGELLTSTNYNKSEKKKVGGKNGYGAKLTNIFSTYFKIETVDRHRKKKFTQVYKNNMKNVGKAKVVDYDGKPFTRVSWIADFERFGISGYNQDMINLMYRRVYDISGITDKSVSVSLNKKKLSIKDFLDYSKLYLNDESIIYEEINDSGIPWKIAVSTSNDKFEQVSFVNGIATSKGGKHVDMISKQITAGLKKQIIKKTKKNDINETYIKNYLKLFIDCLIIDPSFDSQTKERLITTSTKFGSKPQISDKFIKNIIDKTDIVQKVLSFSEFKLSKANKKTDGSKKNKIRDIPKLDDANWAGTKKSEQCILILTEGDSAKSMAISGLSVVGRDTFGAFPLKGKVLNVRDATSDQVMKNTEITHLKKIIGLETGKVYTNTKSLRYGKIMIMTDQDHDGSHIKGLVMNLFHHYWPSLIKLGFITSMITPIIKISLKKSTKSFYTLTDYENWKQSTPNYHKWKVKYYKGLGTSDSKEAKEYFTNLKLNNYQFNESTDDSMNLAFKKEKSNDRKEWLYKYDPEDILDHNQTEIEIPEFINKELIHFSNSDTIRSIGSVYDGLKPSQRKILYSCFKRNLDSEIRVAQLAGYVSENAAYHHGEASLQSAIIGMAQDYIGSNNINLLMPNGQFGTRIMGGHDSASSRYIHTELNPIIKYLYPKSDFHLLNYNEDDGELVEPKYYVPIIPMVLVNGMNGIGTGFSTSIPKFNPLEVINMIRDKLKGKEFNKIHPSYNNFKGKIIQLDSNNYLSKGNYSVIDDKTIRITELPIGRWTEDYKLFLDSLLPQIEKKKSKENHSNSKSKKTIIDYVNNSSDTEVDFTITFEKGFLNSLQWNEDDNIDGIEKFFKLTTTKGLSLRNIHLYKGDCIKKYNSIEEIIDDFFTERYSLYKRRKESQLETLQNELMILKSKRDFINLVIDDKIIIHRKKRMEIITQLLNTNLEQVLKGKVVTKKVNNIDTNNYDYLIKMSIYLFTEEEIDKLNNQIQELEEQYSELNKKTIEQIWDEECKILLKSIR